MEREKSQAELIYDDLFRGSEVSQDVLFGLNPNYKQTIEKELDAGVLTQRTIWDEGEEIVLLRLAEEPRNDPWDPKEYTDGI